jgi:PKD repeat protein
VIVTGDTVQPDPNVLDVRFNASPQVGNVPFSCQFTSYVSGGKAPYSYAWDFNGDGVFDSYLPNPLYTFEKIGQPVGAGTYVIYPVLQVTDGRGVIGTNLDDKDGDSNPDFKMAINVLPAEGGIVVAATANPLTGQAPLSVEFTGAVTAGSGNYEYSWSFGDGETSPFAKTSLASHTYLAAGTYLATVTVHDITTDDSATSEPLTITATVEQAFELTIISDITEGEVPFVVSFEANPVNGTEPIEYQWDIFTDDAIDPEPSLSTPPVLAGAAVVTPDFTYRKNPTVHFANTAGTGAPYNYIARCVGRDSAGNEAVSNLIRVTASPNQTLPYYEAHRPSQVAFSFFEACGGPG